MTTKNTTKSPAQTLEGCRERIADLQAEQALVRAAGLPDAEVEANLRAVLEQAERQFLRTIEAAGRAIAGGRYITTTELLDHQTAAETLAMVAVGGCISTMGQHKFVALARAAAAGQDGPELRLTSRERRDRLEALTKDLHQAQIEEEMLVEKEGAARRPDCDPLAVLGVPYEIAAAHGLIRESA